MFVIIILRTPTTFLFQQLQLVTRIKTWQTSEHQKLSENFHLKISSPFYRLDLKTQYQRRSLSFDTVYSLYSFPDLEHFQAIKEQYWFKDCGKESVGRDYIKACSCSCSVLFSVSAIGYQLYKVYTQTQIQFALDIVGQLCQLCQQEGSKEIQYSDMEHSNCLKTTRGPGPGPE